MLELLGRQKTGNIQALLAMTAPARDQEGPDTTCPGTGMAVVNDSLAGGGKEDSSQ